MDDWLGLRDRAVLVAGAGGLGSACALGFARNGARVCAIDRDHNQLAAVAEAAAAQGLTIQTIVADVSRSTTATAGVLEATKSLGGLDVFLHAVGINERTSVLESTDAQWERIATTNLASAYWLGRAAGGQMCPAGYGRIVFVSSVAGLLAHEQHALYAASKGGLNQLMRVMAREWAADGVTVNAVAPGYTETDLTSAYLGRPGIREQLTSLVPAGRLGTPTDIVGPVLFLASSQAQFVTGHVLYADGGRTLV